MKKKIHPSNKEVNLAGTIVAVGEQLKPKLNAPALMQFFLKAHAKPDDYFSMKLILKRPKRTENQNNYFHVYLGLISLSCGHTVEDLKEWVHQDPKILGQGITEVFGVEVRQVLHTSDLNISEFSEMLNRIQEETEIPLPDPAPFLLPLSFDEYHKLVLDEKESYSKMQNRLSTGT